MAAEDKIKGIVNRWTSAYGKVQTLQTQTQRYISYLLFHPNYYGNPSYHIHIGYQDDNPSEGWASIKLGQTKSAMKYNILPYDGYSGSQWADYLWQQSGYASYKGGMHGRRITSKKDRRQRLRNFLEKEDKEKIAYAINDYMTFNFDFGPQDPNTYEMIVRTGNVLDTYVQTHTKDYMIRELAGAYLNYLIGEEGDDRGVFTFAANEGQVENNVIPIISRVIEEMLIENIPLTTENMNHKLATTFFENRALRRYLINPQTALNHSYVYKGTHSSTSSLSSVRSRSSQHSHRPRSRTRRARRSHTRSRAPSRKRSQTFRFRSRPTSYSSNSESNNE